MILNLISDKGNILPLVNNDKFFLINVDGHTSASTNMATGTIGGVDGDYINSIQAQPRSIVLDLRINPGEDVEDVKRYILQFIKLKKKVKLRWEQLEREIEIEGVVESIEMPRWTNGVTMQVAIHCENPFWEDVDYVIQMISQIINAHYFTEDIYDELYFPAEGIMLGEYDTTRTKQFTNDGDVAVGLEISIMALGTVTNPIMYAEDGSFFGIGYGTGNKQLVMNAGDVIRINTKKGQKSVTLNGVPVFDKIKSRSTWLQLESGINTFSINSDDQDIDNMYFSLQFKQLYI